MTLMSEKRALKESRWTDLSPTALFTQPDTARGHVPSSALPVGVAGVYPGWCMTGGYREGLYRVLP